MSFAQLATVEVQLIMHGCDRRTLLQLARCCHFIRTAASSTFAWNRVPPTPISWSLGDETWQANWEKIQSSLLRYGPVALEWLPPQIRSRLARPMVNDEEFLQLSTFIADAKPVVSFDVQRRRFDARHRDQLLSLPCLGALRVLHLPPWCGYVDTFLHILVEHMPNLHTLTLNPVGGSTVSVNLELLGQLDHLTDLRVNGHQHVGGFACRHVRKLSLMCRMECPHPAWNVLLTSSYLRSLEYLSLTFPFTVRRNDVAAKWEDILRNLSLLTTLTIRDCNQMDPLVAALIAHGQTLRTLHFASDVNKAQPHLAFPSIGQLSEILTRNPMLTTMRFDMPNCQTCPDLHYIEQIDRATTSFIWDVQKILHPAFPIRKIELFDYYHPTELLNVDDSYDGDNPDETDA